MIPTSERIAAYELKKQSLIPQIRQHQASADTIRIEKKTSNLFRHRPPAGKGIDVRNFNAVIDINKEQGFVDVEGMTPYHTLVDACLAQHCLPTVVPELKTITVGGAIAGCGIESSSFKYGLVHETVQEIEVLLADGQVVVCRPDNAHSDLFYGFPNSYGTLGYVLRAKVALYPVMPFVKVVHRHFTDKVEFFSALHELCQTYREHPPVDFIEGVVFAPDHLVISTAEGIETAPYQSDYTSKNIYYRSVATRNEDYLSIKDYIWRWDTDWFWCSKFFHMQHPVVRRLAGSRYLNSKTYWQLRRFFANNPYAKWILDKSMQKTESIIQDVQIPIDKAADFLNFFERDIGIHPVWICPTHAYRNDVIFDLYALDPNTLYINFGFWDMKPWSTEEGHYNRLIEQMVTQLGGKKSLYSNVYYSEDEFWQLYNKSRYDDLKMTYDPQARFRSLYAKCVEK